MNKLAVIAIGGNALMPDKDHASMEMQYKGVYETVQHIAGMVQDGWNVVIVHGNGPQVGLILRQSELAKQEVPPVPMDYAGAFTQGSIGYMFCTAMRKVFTANGIKKDPVAIVTQTLVDKKDPAFANPSKPVGNWFGEAEAKEMATHLGWHIVEDSGRGWRRVVPSPIPLAIPEIDVIRRLVDMDIPVICAGGGGIPVIAEEGGLKGVDAVIDKDRTAAILAEQLGASMFILPTAVDKVSINFGKPNQQNLDTMTMAEAAEYMAQGQFPAGSMGPKVQALMQYVKATGGVGVITTPRHMRDALTGKAGTRLVR